VLNDELELLEDLELELELRELELELRELELLEVRELELELDDGAANKLRTWPLIMDALAVFTPHTCGFGDPYFPYSFRKYP
jgi:hypothetical protein